MRLNDAIVGVVLLVFAIAVIAYSTTFPSLHGQAYGPSLFPTLIGVGLVACALVLIARGLHRRRQSKPNLSTTHAEPLDVPSAQDWIDWGEWASDPARRINMLLVPVLLIAYIALSDAVGFIPLSILMLSILLYRLGASILLSLLTAIATTALLQLLFAKVLLVPLPAGLLLRWTG